MEGSGSTKVRSLTGGAHRKAVGDKQRRMDDVRRRLGLGGDAKVQVLGLGELHRVGTMLGVEEDEDEGIHAELSTTRSSQRRTAAKKMTGPVIKTQK